MENFIKKSLSIILVFVIIICSLSIVYAEENNTTYTFPNLESYITTHGRTYINNNKLEMNWSASGVSFTFTGTGAICNLQGVDEKSMVKVFVDNDETLTKSIIVVPIVRDFVLCENLPYGTHTVTIRKSTETFPKRQTMLVDLTIIGGTLQTPPKKSTRTIEIIGDSITCGQGDVICDGSQSTYRMQDQDATISYGAVASDMLGAEYSLVCRSGIGFVHSPDENVIGIMKDVYEFLDWYALDKTTKWDFKSNPSDIVVISLGTNDFYSGCDNDTFYAGAIYFMNKVRELNPDSIIIWTYGMMTTDKSDLLKNAVKELNDIGDKNIYYMQFDSINPSKEGYGGTGHPSYKTHKNNGIKLANFISSLTGWSTDGDYSKDRDTFSIKEKSKIGYDADCVYGFAPNTKVKDINCFESCDIIQVLDNNGNVCSDNTIISSGMKICKMFGANSICTAEISVLGDVDGDGDITSNDALMTLQKSVNKISFSAPQRLSASFDGQDVNAAAALKILQFAVKKISSF